MCRTTRILITLFQLFLAFQVAEVITSGTSIFHQFYGVVCAGWIVMIQLVKYLIKVIEGKQC